MTTVKQLRLGDAIAGIVDRGQLADQVRAGPCTAPGDQPAKVLTEGRRGGRPVA
ncbi:hypothetical protein AB1484_10310 [Parafrankia sp. FMc6]|uniref:hypothetical protein n=1 Tax=Parafrankia soli TaxID=2599596 RepID=UPI0034D5B12F